MQVEKWPRHESEGDVVSKSTRTRNAQPADRRSTPLYVFLLLKTMLACLDAEFRSRQQHCISYQLLERHASALAWL